MSNIPAKAELRRRMLVQRQSLSQEQVLELSLRVGKRLEQLQPLKQARVIMAYSSIKNEVYLNRWLDNMRSQGKTILLPRVEGDDLVAVEYRGWEACGNGPFGINEPDGEPYDTEAIDAILIPGLAFDGSGYRLGYGKGYYDRFLTGISETVFRCGVAFEFQVVDTIFPGDRDIPMHWIVSDRSEVAVDMRFF